MIRRPILFLAACFIFVCAARADSDKRVLKVMTRNMDAGTDLQFFFGIPVPFPTLNDATAATFGEALASDIPGRAGRLADEIAAQEPDLVALEEVTLWTQGPPGGPPGIVLDQLQLLLNALSARHLHYKLVVVQHLSSASLPSSISQIVSFTDRNAILARSDLKQSEMDLSNVQQSLYHAAFPLPIGGSVLGGWLSVDVKVRGKVFRFVGTHLQSPIAGIPAATAVQVAQADELIGILSSTKLPVVLAGDFNANAELGPDDTASTVHILGAGYSDAWRAFNPPGTGFTWPLFFEDFAAGTPIVPFERIDLIFVRDLNVLAVQQTGVTLPSASDHIGVVATVQIEP